MSGKIYRITDHTNNNVYFGSTIMDLDDRLRKHKYAFNSFVKHGGNQYCSSVEIIKNKNYSINLVENVDDGINLRERERWYIENNECINKVIPLRTETETAERVRKWYDEHIEICKDRTKKWVANNKEYVKEYKKQYAIDNAEKRKETNRKWREENKDEINRKRRERRHREKEEKK